MLGRLSRRNAIIGFLSILFISLIFLLSTASNHTRNTNSLKGSISLDSIASLDNTASQFNLTKEQLLQCLDAGEEPTHYLSIVVVTRMDDYANEQHHRLQNFIDSAYLLAEHTRQKIEVLMIEWNPPAERRRIIDSFRFRRSKYLDYRIITIPESLHNKIPSRGKAPLHEFEGKNVGIRFARGEFIVCTNQDDIWSHNFHNAVMSKAFKKGIVYVQHQDWHNIHDNLPPSIVNLPKFPDDDMLFNACKLNEQDWGNYVLPEPVPVDDHNIFKFADQAGDFTMAHRDTWKVPRGYRESGGIAWVDVEFLATATWTFDIPVVYSEKTMSCHQEHTNVWEGREDSHTEKTGLSEIMRHEVQYVNEEGKWGLQQYDIYAEGVECIQFRGGLLL